MIARLCRDTVRRILPASLALVLAGTAEAQSPPNVVVILADDLGWADLGVYGSTFHRTPHLDRLAAEGMRFTQAYAAASICSPTRASLLTGRSPARLHQTDWIPGQGDRPDQRLLQVEDLDELPLAEVTLAEVLRSRGYATAHIGKWHLGGEGHLPTDQGFDLNIAGNHTGSPPTYFWPYDARGRSLPELRAGGREGEYLPDRLGREAARFIAEHRDRPFFLYLPYYAVHTPLEAPEEQVEAYRARLGADAGDDALASFRGNVARVRQTNPVYAAMVEGLDRSVGHVLRSLEENGVADRTIVVFLSDNGGLSVLQRDRSSPPTSNRPLRAGKGWLFEGGIRIPMLVRWPGVTAPGSTSDVPVSTIDLLPTLLAGIGAEPPTAPIDGVSLLPVLRGADRLERRELFWHYPHYHGSGSRPSSAVRSGDLKLIQWLEDESVELYDLAADPRESNDLATRRPEVAARLRARLEAWRRDIGAQMPRANPDYTAGGAR